MRNGHSCWRRADYGQRLDNKIDLLSFQWTLGKNCIRCTAKGDVLEYESIEGVPPLAYR